MTTDELLIASNAFESKKAALRKISECVAQSQIFYQWFITLSDIAYHEDKVLHSKDGYRTNPLVTFASQKNFERKADIARRWSERKMKQSNALMIEYLSSQIKIENLF